MLASSLGLGSLASLALYKFVRPLFPVSVNCHFCNGNFKVSDLTVLVVDGVEMLSSGQTRGEEQLGVSCL